MFIQKHPMPFFFGVLFASMILWWMRSTWKRSTMAQPKRLWRSWKMWSKTFREDEESGAQRKKTQTVKRWKGQAPSPKMPETFSFFLFEVYTRRGNFAQNFSWNACSHVVGGWRVRKKWKAQRLGWSWSCVFGSHASKEQSAFCNFCILSGILVFIVLQDARIGSCDSSVSKGVDRFDTASPTSGCVYKTALVRCCPSGEAEKRTVNSLISC